MTSRTRPWLILVLGLAALVADWSGGGTPPATAAGDIVVAVADDVVLDPHRAPLPNSWLVARLVHRGLYAFPAENEPAGSTPIPDLATGPVRRVAPRLYEIDVRSGRFSSGRQLSAADIASSIRRFVGARTGAGRFADAIVAVRTVREEPIRIRIETSRPEPALAWVLAHPQAAIVPATTRARVPAVGPPGLGPYRVESRALERSLMLVRNHHWTVAGDPVRVAPANRILVEVAGTPNAALAAVERGDAHLLGDSGPPDLLAAHNAPIRRPGRCTRIVAIDHQAPGLDRLAARRPIRDVLEPTDLPTAGTTRAAGLLPPLVDGARTSPRTAQPAKIGVSRTLTLAGSNTPRDRTELDAIARRLRNAGASVTISTRAPALHARLLEAPSATRPDLLLFTWCSEWPGLAGRTFLEPLTGRGKLAPRSERLHDAIVRARRLEAGDDADAAWAAAEAVLRDAAVLVPVGWPAEIAAFSGIAGTPVTAPMFPQGDPANVDPAP